MRRAYQLLLKLYPADFRAVFGAEMVQSFEQSGRGAAKELFSLVSGSVREHMAKFLHPKSYLQNTVDFETSLNKKTTVQELEQLIRSVIGEIQFAIAHHDFPRARVCSENEKKARQRLEQLSAS